MHFRRLPALFALALLLSLASPAQANPLGDLMRYSELPANDGVAAAYYPEISFNAGPGSTWSRGCRLASARARTRCTCSASPRRARNRRRPPHLHDRPRGRFHPRDVLGAAVAADPVNKRNLVIWASDHKDGTELEVYGQLLDAAGNEIGTNDFSISGANSGTYYPEIAFNPGARRRATRSTWSSGPVR